MQRVVAPLEPVPGFAYVRQFLARAPIASSFAEPMLYSLPMDLAPLTADDSPLQDLQSQVTEQAGSDWERVMFPLPKRLPEFMTSKDLGHTFYAHYRALRGNYEPFRDDFYSMILDSRRQSKSSGSIGLRSLLNRSSQLGSNPHRNVDGSIRQFFWLKNSQSPPDSSLSFPLPHRHRQQRPRPVDSRLVEKSSNRSFAQPVLF